MHIFIDNSGSVYQLLQFWIVSAWF